MRIRPARFFFSMLALSFLMYVTSARAQSWVTVYGSNNGAKFGTSIAGGSDFDGDGKSDYIVGSPDYTATGGVSGKVTVFSNSGTILYTIAPTTMSFRQRFGEEIEIVGRIDGDSVDDFVVSGSVNCSEPGTPIVRAYSGATGAQIWSISGTPGSLFGYRMAIVGDLNGDSIPEIVVGAPNQSKDPSHTSPWGSCTTTKGLVSVLSGSTGNVIGSYSGSNYHDQIGSDVTGLPDVTGDGIPDYAAITKTTSYIYDAVKVFSGSNKALFKTVTVPKGVRSLARFNDFNSDGVPDILVGNPSASSNPNAYEGGVYVVSVTGTGSVLATIHGTVANAGLGTAIKLIGLINGDSVPDFAVSAQGAYVRIISGSNLSTINTVSADRPEGYFGYSLGLTGDLNVDGIPDFAIGVPLDSTNFPGGGSIRVVYAPGPTTPPPSGNGCDFKFVGPGVYVCL